MPKSAALFALLLGACSTAGLQQGAPVATLHSSRAREALADCLMDRLASGDFRVHKSEAAAATSVAVTGVIGTYFLFTLTDSPHGGTDVAMHRANGIAPGLHNAESCIS